MPKFVQQVAGKTFGLFEPRLDWAKDKIVLIGETAGSLKGTYIEPKLDWAKEKTESIKGTYFEPRLEWAREKIVPVSTKIAEVQGLMLVKSLDFVDSSESFIDRLLPAPASAESEEAVDKDSLPLRIVRLPFRAPIRVSMVVYMKGNGVVDAVVVSGRNVAGVAHEKQTQFCESILQRTKPITDRVQSRYQSTTLSLQGHRDSARKIVAVNVEGVIVRLRLVEAKDWSLNKADSLRTGTVSMASTIMQGAHETSARIIGQHRATFIFSKLQRATFVLTRVQLPLQLCDQDQLLETSQIKDEAQMQVQDSIAG